MFAPYNCSKYCGILHGLAFVATRSPLVLGEYVEAWAGETQQHLAVPGLQRWLSVPPGQETAPGFPSAEGNSNPPSAGAQKSVAFSFSVPQTLLQAHE